MRETGNEVFHDGRMLQAYKSGIFAAEGTFYADTLSSRDGLSWQAVNAEEAPQAAYGGYLFRFENEAQLRAWQPGEAARHVAVGAAARDASCRGQRCIVLADALLLLNAR